VWRLNSLTSETAEQQVYYSEGVGTKHGEVARGGSDGYGIDDEIIEAYTWLIQDFDEGRAIRCRNVRWLGSWKRSAH
jgi:uncharacterized protein (DUF2235 family)